MTYPAAKGLNRRDVLGLSVVSVVSAMLAASLPATARAQSAILAADPRRPAVDRVADLVIPDTDTPGAASAGAGAFVLLAIDRGIGGLSKAMWDKVVEALDAAASASFLRLPAERQASVLSSLDAAAFAAPAAPADSQETAWRRIKAAIAAGYYCSEIGATKELVYEPVPGEFRTLTLTADFRNRSNEGFGGGLS